MVFSDSGVATDELSSGLLLPVLPQLVDDVGEPDDGLDSQGNNLALRAALDVDWGRRKENRELVQ